ncbi:MAG: hypothetical protein WAN87_02270 [Thermoplasmata archaeon]
MSAFRGSDEALDREIETLEWIARQRVRRYASELKNLDQELRELRRLRTQRRVETEVVATEMEAIPDV